MHQGSALNGAASRLSLTLAEQAQLKQLLHQEQHKLKPELENVRKTFTNEQVQRLVDGAGLRAKMRSE